MGEGDMYSGISVRNILIILSHAGNRDRACTV